MAWKSPRLLENENHNQITMRKWSLVSLMSQQRCKMLKMQKKMPLTKPRWRKEPDWRRSVPSEVDKKNFPCSFPTHASDLAANSIGKKGGIFLLSMGLCSSILSNAWSHYGGSIYVTKMLCCNQRLLSVRCPKWKMAGLKSADLKVVGRGKANFVDQRKAFVRLST